MNNKTSFLKSKAVIAAVITFALFMITVLGTFVCLVIEWTDDSGAYVIEGGGSSKGTSAQKDDTPVSLNPKEGKKTGIVLPCATKEGDYLMPSDSSTVDISGDTAISSAAAALINVSKGSAVALKNANVKIYPASMTKVMTLLVACENAKDPNALLTVTEEMVKKYNNSYNASTEKGPSTATTWKAGYQVSVEDLLYMIIYESDTYACWLVADYVAGDEEGFVKLMNEKAKSLKIDGTTHFANVTGLYDDAHYTTCLDMAAIMAAAMNNESAAKVLMSKDFYEVDIYSYDGDADDAITVGMWSNWFTGRLEEYKYPKTAAKYAGNGSDIELIGGKTGYETIPTHCYVTAGRNDVTGTLYVCVQVGRINDTQEKISAETSTDDSRVIYQKYAKE